MSAEDDTVGNEERRANEAEWRGGMETQIAELRTEMRANTVVTRQTRDELSALTLNAAPVLAGLRVLGNIGRGTAWLAKWSFRTLKVLAPIAAALATVWAVWKGFWKP